MSLRRLEVPRVRWGYRQRPVSQWTAVRTQVLVLREVGPGQRRPSPQRVRNHATLTGEHFLLYRYLGYYRLPGYDGACVSVFTECHNQYACVSVFTECHNQYALAKALSVGSEEGDEKSKSTWAI